MKASARRLGRRKHLIRLFALGTCLSVSGTFNTTTSTLKPALGDA